jgi:peptide/nickel transport system ATP-binding protein
MNSNSAGESVLRIENLEITYQTRRCDVAAVRDISFDLRRGEALGLVGESGCGKSTLAYAAMGYLTPNAKASGQILLHGEDLLKKSEKELQSIRGKEIAMVYQDPMATLNPSFRIGEQLIEVMTVHEGLSKSHARRRCIEMLAKVKMSDPEAVMERYPHQLSGGQQQRVVIAMALLCNPALLILDEPTTALDVTVEATILDHIKALRGEFDSAILYISHNLGVIARVCDRVAVMYAGEIVEEADVQDIFLSPRHIYTQGLIACVPHLGTHKATTHLNSIPGQIFAVDAAPSGCLFAPRCACALDRCHQEHPDLTLLPDGRKVRGFLCSTGEVSLANLPMPDVQPISALPAAPNGDAARGPLLSVSGLKTYYAQEANSSAGVLKRGAKRQVKAVDDVSFEMQPRSIVGIVGESGCGKSSLAKTVAGLVVQTEGQIEFLGADISKVVEKRDRKIVQELQMIFQNPDSSLNPTMTVRQIIARPLLLSGVVPRVEIEQETRRLLNNVNLNESYLDRRPGQLSGGEKQRVAIARAFAGRPELVICDEPVSSLDVSVQCCVLNTLLDIQQAYGTSLLFISHDLSVVRYLCDTIVVMYLGKECESGPSDSFFMPPYHPYTEALLSAVSVPDPCLQQARIRLEGTPPSALEPPTGCRFHTRCPRKVGLICETVEPPAQVLDKDYAIYCHIPVAELRQVKPVVDETALHA